MKRAALLTLALFLSFITALSFTCTKASAKKKDKAEEAPKKEYKISFDEEFTPESVKWPGKTKSMKLTPRGIYKCKMDTKKAVLSLNSEYIDFSEAAESEYVYFESLTPGIAYVDGNGNVYLVEGVKCPFDYDVSYKYSPITFTIRATTESGLTCEKTFYIEYSLEWMAYSGVSYRKYLDHYFYISYDNIDDLYEDYEDYLTYGGYEIRYPIY